MPRKQLNKEKNGRESGVFARVSSRLPAWFIFLSFPGRHPPADPGCIP